MRMVDVGDKPPTRRRARATALVRVGEATREKILSGALPKGDVLAVARVAGIMAAKLTPQIVPLCHPLPLEAVEVDVKVVEDGVEIQATARTTARTGVEMEAMVAAAAAALAVYDMIKGVERGAVIEQVRLEEKEGGRSGHWKRGE